MSLRWLLVPAILAGSLLLGLGVGRSLVPSSADPAELAVQKRLLCPQCAGGVRLDACDLTLCQDMKADISRRLQAGEGEDEIVNTYASAYGPSILAEPTGVAQASIWLSWAAAALAGLWLAARFRWRRERLQVQKVPA